ncbi:MAG: DegT/DnrJ/EryC1/StrS family aminotransferase [Desulfobacteraceae bacterium]|nr:MAG: DegT/DnrJ/EryC1/StrS family aminotransferase [Desulfobacteraceae bacterium]
MEYIPVANVITEEEDARAVYDVVKSGWLSKGKKVDEFEKKFAEKVETRNAIAVNSGTSAIHTVLAALEVGPGDEVILPSLTFISTANAVLYQGATPVLVECDPKTYNTTPEILEAAITPRTRALMPVDMNGMPVDYEPILELGRRRGIPVISDSAESLGAVYKGRKVGGIAPIHCFSFFPNKAITTGEGGMITTDDKVLAEKMRKILNQGQDGRYNHVVLGYNYRMTDIQAALGIVQLARLERIVSEKEEIVRRYRDLLKGARGIELPFLPPYVDRHSWYMFAVQVEETIRDMVVEYLEKNSVQTRLSFPPVHIQPYYRERFGYGPDSLPASYHTWKRLINLPIWPGLDAEKIGYVAQTLMDALKG